MINNVDLDLLHKTYQNAAIGITAVEAVIDKVSNHGLESALQKQKKDYQELAHQSKQQLMANGEEAKEKPLYDRAMMKGNVKMNTLMDSSDSHIAQMVIQGSTMGVTQMTKLIHAHENADGTCLNIAKEFVKREEENIEEMKKFL